MAAAKRGRPPRAEPRLQSSVWWPSRELLERLDAYAREHGLSRSEAIVRAVRRMLECEG